MSRRATIGFSLLAFVVILLLWSRQTYEPLTYYSSRSYVERTNHMIRRGALAFDCREDRVVVTPAATEAERKWVEASYLRSDIELFNRNRELFGHFFIVTDCQLREINPYLRTVRLPFAKSIEWAGNIEYSGPGAHASFISANGRTVDITRTAGDALPGDVRTIVGRTNDVAGNVVHFDFAGGGRTPAVEVHSVEGTAVLEQRVKRGQPADVRLLGNAIGEGRIARLQSGDWLRLSSTSPSPVSETFLFTEELRFARLSNMRTRNARQERIFTESDPLLQWVGGEQGEEMLTFGEALARGVGNALQQVGDDRARQLANEFDIQLSIDRGVQESLDRSLATYARRLANDVAAGDPFAASVTVMNGRTGEIVAAASYPGQSELESMRGVSEEEQRRLLVNHNFKRHPIGSAGKPFFYAAIGSRHPFLLDLTVEPHAPQLRPDGGEGEREVLQFFIGRDYKLWPHADAPTDLGSAIERSCNKYTVEMATLALAAERDVTDRKLTRPLEQVFRREPGVLWPKAGAVDGPRVNGQLIDFPVSLGVYMKNDARPVPPREITSAAVTPGTLDRIDEVPFIETFSELTGVRTYGGGAAPGVPLTEGDSVGRGAMVTLNYDLRPWAPLLQKLADGQNEKTSWNVRAALQSVSPERVNLSLNQVTDFRTEFVSLLLGGSSSLWTNVQLTEALSRLVTKRQVEATMLHALRPRGRKEAPAEEAPRTFAELQISGEARELVLRGMQRVILGASGTAKPMASRLVELQQRFPEHRIAIFSKTGSPTVVRPESKPAGEIIAQLVRRGFLFYDRGRLAVSTDRKQGSVPYVTRGAAGRDAFVSTLHRAARIAARQTGAAATPRTLSRIVAYTDRFARYRGQLVFSGPAAVRLDENTASPFHVVAGQLVLNRAHPIFDPAQQSDSSAVYIFTIVKWRGTGDIPTPQELEQEDARVLSVAIYVDIGPGSAVAVEAARQMVPDLVKLLE